MKEYRSASQVLFGFLPEQTVDLQGRVWKVRRWRRPVTERNVDLGALRRELVRLARPWAANQTDSGYVRDLEAGWDLAVHSLDRDNGVEVEPFPRIWICSSCNRIVHSLEQGGCRCGSRARPNQLHFVGYHEACGRIRSPRIRRCQEHNDVRVVWPGTASAAEIRFECPECGRVTQNGFGMPTCDCGEPGPIRFTVHRAASVYTAHPVVIVNPPSPEKLKMLSEAGGPARALSWVLEGMPTRTLSEWSNTASAFRRQLIQQGFEQATADRMVRIAVESGEVRDDDNGIPLREPIAQQAEFEAVTIATALSESRMRLEDLPGSVSESSPLREAYARDYPTALARAGLEAVDLVDSFPVLTGHFGYTRGGATPDSRLVPYRTRDSYVVYGDLGVTEALFVRLDPVRVATWLRGMGFDLADWDGARSARTSVLGVAHIPGLVSENTSRTPGTALLNLVHSYAHRFIRIAAVNAGIDRNALSELLVPSHLGFFVYAAARADFVLGGLQSVYETELHTMLRAIVFSEHRCPLDPGCMRAGGACMACLHLGEPSCRLFNRFLSRDVLSGAKGYLTGVIGSLEY